MGQMIDFNRALQETRQMIEPPDMGMIRFNNWAKRQNAMAQVPQDEDWQAEQRNTMFMDGYRPNSSLVPGVSTTPADPHGFNASSGVSLEDSPEMRRRAATEQMSGYRPNSSYVPTEAMYGPGYAYNFGADDSGWDEGGDGEQQPPPGQEPPGDEQTDGDNKGMEDSIRQELKRNDDGTYQYALGVLQRLPEVFARYEKADPSRAMPYFLAGQPGRQRETEMVRFNEFVR